MNFTDTLKSAWIVLNTGEVPLIIGESGIGKTALAKKLAKEYNMHLTTIDGNLLKEGEIGGLPTIQTFHYFDKNNKEIEGKETVYAVHTKLREIDIEILKGRDVLLFIDEINRCEHAVLQELMNLILNREINGYKLNEKVKIMAAMNPSNKYTNNFDYQVTEMDPAQENRFVWLNLDCDSSAWIKWALKNKINSKVIEFISTFPDHLYKKNEDDIDATPRSYERISKILDFYYQNSQEFSDEILFNIIKGNAGSVIAHEFISFIKKEYTPLISFDDVFKDEYISNDLIDRIKSESHTRLYLSASNILSILDDCDEINNYIQRLIEFLKLYPVDLMIGIMKEMKLNHKKVYEKALNNDDFIECYFNGYDSLRG